MTIVLLMFGGVWIALNIFFLPFYPWTEGLHRPWLILNGLVPYKDFIWIRTPLDIFLLSFVYKIVGVSEFAYQAVVFLLHVCIGLLLFLGLRTKSLRLAISSYIFYTLLLFPLFINTEIGEILVSFFILATFFFLLNHSEGTKTRWLFLAGMTHSLAVLAKQTSLFSVIAALLWYAVRCSKQSVHSAFKDFLRGVGTYGSGFLLPVAVFWGYLAKTGAFDDFIHFTVSFNLFVYSSWSKPWGIVGGSRMIGVFLSILLFHIVTKNGVVLNQSARLLLYLLIFSLFPSLLPSFWSYRLITAFPLISILGGEIILSVHQIITEKKRRTVLEVITVVLCFVLFLFGLGHFVREYGGFIKDNGLKWGQYIHDYGDSERHAAEWLATNTKPRDKIFNMANNIIMLKAHRFPHNKYIDAIPAAYYPLDNTFFEITKIPPQYVIFDRTLLDTYPEIGEWKFYRYLKDVYTLQKTFDTIEIYAR